MIWKKYKISSSQGLARKDGEIQHTEIILYGGTMMCTCVLYLSKSIRYTKPRANPNINYKPWVIMVHNMSKASLWYSILKEGSIKERDMDI